MLHGPPLYEYRPNGRSRSRTASCILRNMTTLICISAVCIGNSGDIVLIVAPVPAHDGLAALSAES